MRLCIIILCNNQSMIYASATSLIYFSSIAILHGYAAIDFRSYSSLLMY